MMRTARWATLATVAVGALIGVGCGDGASWNDGGRSRPRLSLEIVGEPTVAYDPARGRTTVVAQFIARDRNGVPLDPADLSVAMRVDGDQVDNESVLQQSSEELASSLHYALVLDASGSMLQHVPPAFAPMKEAARASVQEGVELWRGRAGEFSWDVSWFNDFLFHQLGGWSPDDLSSIPAPALDAATSLYAGVEFMAGEMLEAYQAGTAAGSRDHHVMVVLSDGADNLSELDNSQVDPVSQTTQSGAEYLRFGWPSTELADAVAAVRAHPRLTVHVLAMGSNFAEGDLENLTKLADAGNGQLLENPEAGEIGSLFGRVTKEFSTLQTRGASIPQQSGKHTFTVEVTGTGSGERGSTSFRYQAGPEARVLE